MAALALQEVGIDTPRLYEIRARAKAEQELAPLDLNDTETLDWLAEYCDQAVYNRPTPQYRGGFTLYTDEGKTSAGTLREAVCLAAAKHKAANEYL
jgi:hypothetical protein